MIEKVCCFEAVINSGRRDHIRLCTYITIKLMFVFIFLFFNFLTNISLVCDKIKIYTKLSIIWLFFNRIQISINFR